jgi:hypothetical protein
LVVVVGGIVGEGVVVVGDGGVGAFVEETGERGGLTDPLGALGEEGGGGDECGV